MNAQTYIWQDEEYESLEDILDVYLTHAEEWDQFLVADVLVNDVFVTEVSVNVYEWLDSVDVDTFDMYVNASVETQEAWRALCTSVTETHSQSAALP